MSSRDRDPVVGDVEEGMAAGLLSSIIGVVVEEGGVAAGLLSSTMGAVVGVSWVVVWVDAGVDTVE